LKLGEYTKWAGGKYAQAAAPKNCYARAHEPKPVPKQEWLSVLFHNLKSAPVHTTVPNFKLLKRTLAR
jgi:hypothetical protein